MTIFFKHNSRIKASFSTVEFFIVITLLVVSSVFMIMLNYGNEFANFLTLGIWVIMALICKFILKDLYLIASLDDNSTGLYRLYSRATKPIFGYIILWCIVAALLLFISISLVKIMQFIPYDSILAIFFVPIGAITALIVVSLFGSRYVVKLFSLSIAVVVALIGLLIYIITKKISVLGVELNFSAPFNIISLFSYSIVFFMVILIPATFIINNLRNKYDVIPAVIEFSSNMTHLFSVILMVMLFFVFSVKVDFSSFSAVSNILFYTCLVLIMFFVSLVLYCLAWLLYTMADDKLFISYAGECTKGGTPVNSIIIISLLFMAVYVGVLYSRMHFASFFYIITLLSALIIAYSSFAVFKFRSAEPDKFDISNFKLFNLLFIVLSVFFTVVAFFISFQAHDKAVFIISGVIIIFAVFIYGFFRYYFNERFIIGFGSLFSFFSFFREVPADIKPDAKHMFSGENRKVLIIGIGIMPYLKLIATPEYKANKFYIVSNSKIENFFIKRYIHKNSLEKHIRLLYSVSQKLDSRIPRCDAAICVNYLSRLIVPNGFLVHFNLLLKHDSPIIFIDKRCILNFNIRPWFSSDSQLITTFSHSGIKANISRKTVLFNRLHILKAVKTTEATFTHYWSRIWLDN